ncbi:hypothetical protein ATEIFO6365_0007034500 [Aspergillus terreus]|uniref:Uncharacterized protein n=1 Tax=Aspergillus terreus TaxID=33178 RepID=A0A5M3Z637_ASPTE|nr:hypothetical protein ATETN484_0009034500 [Aspergillus terreus]GFF17796.1 hypothetical protein ATEIFO6365_0007034500 [Aspergillus terreus]
MKASILGSILFVALATASSMESHPSPNGAAMDMAMKRGMSMDMKDMPSADMNMKHGMRMGKMPSNDDDGVGMKRDMDMNMDNVPAHGGNGPMSMNTPMEGKGQLPGMEMGMPTGGAMEDMPRGMPSAENMPGMDMGMDDDMDEGMGMGQDKEGMME